MGVFRKILDAIHSVWPKSDEVYSYRSLSRFRLLAEDMIDGKLSDDVIHAAELCEEALRITRTRITLSEKDAETEEEMRELEAYGSLTEDEAKYIKNMLSNFLAVTNERNMLLEQLTEFDKSVNKMYGLEKEAESAIPQIQEAEKMQRILRQDVGRLEGERSDLEYEREVLLSGQDFANKFTVGAVAAFSVATIILGFMFIIQGKPIFYPSAILSLCVIVAGTVIYIFRRHIATDLKLNARKQSRCIELLNKKNANFVYYTNFLRYEYGKYKVRSSRMLMENMKEYERYRKVATRLDAIRDIMYESEKRTEQLLRDKNLYTNKFSLRQFAKTIDIEDKQNYYNDLKDQRLKLEQRMAEVDRRHQSVWQLVEELNLSDDTKVVDAMMKKYFEEAAKLVEKAVEKVEAEENLEQGILKPEDSA